MTDKATRSRASEEDGNSKGLSKITSSQNQKLHESQMSEKDRVISDLNKSKNTLQNTISDFRVSLDKKNKIIEQKCKEIVEKKVMIDAKNWIIQDKDKIVEE